MKNKKMLVKKYFFTENFLGFSNFNGSALGSVHFISNYKLSYLGLQRFGKNM
jgi:hypothetical protein